MKNRFIATIAGFFLASVAATEAQTTLTAWTFDNVAIGINASPQPSTGLGTASALGMNNSYNNTNSVSNPDVQSLAGSSSGGPDCWRVRGFSTVAGSEGNGWSTNAPIGTQGAQFSGSTFGYYRIKVSFDVYATSDAEANLQVQSSTDGSHWYNANIVSANSGTIATNTTSANTVTGTYISLVGGWNNQVTVDLSGISGVDNNSAFAVRIVNASTGPDCLNTTGTIYDNTSGSWSLDNVVIQGQTLDVVADWDFDLIGSNAAPYNSPAPTTGSGTTVVLGMTNNYIFSDNTPTNPDTNSLAWADVLLQGGASTGNNSYCWRVRGGNTAAGAPNSGWNSQAPLMSQGAEFDSSTSGYSNIVCSFDVYFTTQAPDKFCVLYTTDGWATTNIANSLFYGANPNDILTNGSNPLLVTGNYFYQTNGQGWYNDVVVDLTGVTAAANNPLFGIRIVNAGTGAEDQNFLGQPYNNLSGNMRFDNVTIAGTAGTPAPALQPAANASVDAPFSITFTDNPQWRANITHIYVNGLVLANTAYTTVAGQITFNPAKSPLLQTSGMLNISVVSLGFGTARVAQPVAAGVATQLAITTQTAGPTASGGTLTGNPAFLVADQYGNGTTNPYVNVTITAAVGGTGGWTLGGATQQASTNGVVAFTNLNATLNGSTPISNAYITFTVTGYGATFNTNSPVFTIGSSPVPFTPGNLAVFQIDTASLNTTFSIIEVNPSTANQAAPVNIVPISATGTNALRQAPEATTGRLALSDDGTLVVFSAFADGSAATPDETLNLSRAAAAMTSTNVLKMLGTYTSLIVGGSEARAACVLDDDRTWIADDHGGLYEGNFGANLGSPNLNNYNNVVVKTFGGNPWVETQKAVAGQNIPEVYELGLDPDTGLYDVTFANNLNTDQYASDYYLVSTNGGISYDILYINDQAVTGSVGIIKKYSLVSGNWTANGSFTNSAGVDGLFATTNGDGGVNLFFTTGAGGTPNNSVVRVTDSTGWNQNINITSSSVLYTATGSASLKGLTFVPQSTSNTVQLIPPPVLTAQNGVTVGNSFTVTNTPADPAWHGAITNITVNGSPLPQAAYDITQSGSIVFNPSQSVLLQGRGSKTITVTATGYSSVSVNQSIILARPILGGVSLTGGATTFSFSSATGFSFSVLATNNLTAPLATWPVIGTATESPAGSGNYQFTDPNPATNSQLFYLLRQP